MPICDRCEIGERQRIFSSVSFSTYSQCRIPYCYTGGLLPAGRGITVPRNIFTCADYPRPAVVAGWHLQSVCAARISPRGPSLALRAIHLVPRLRRPKLDVAVRQPKCGKVLYHAVVKILCRSPFPAYAVYHLHPSYDYKGNGCSKRVETVGVYPFCPLPWVRQTLPPPQRRNPCPESANRLRGSGTPQKLCLRIPVREYDINAKTVRHRSAERFREVFTFSCPEALCDGRHRRSGRNRRCSRRTS